jgi:hypothetical protein
MGYQPSNVSFWILFFIKQFCMVIIYYTIRLYFCKIPPFSYAEHHLLHLLLFFSEDSTLLLHHQLKSGNIAIKFLTKILPCKLKLSLHKYICNIIQSYW